MKKFLLIVSIFILSSFCMGNEVIKNDNNIVYKNIYVENTDIGKMDFKQSKEILTKEYKIDNIVLRYEDRNWVISPEDIDLTYNIDDCVKDALDYTNTESISTNLRRKLALSLNKKYYIKIKSNYDKSKLDNKIDKVCNSIDKQVADAILSIDLNGSFKTTPSCDGVSVYRSKLKKSIESMINKKEYGDLQIPVKIQKPKLTTEDIKSINCVLGQFSTSFNNNTSRGSNIHIAGETSGDLIIRPGEEYSYNNVTGPRVLSRGYKYAPVIVGKRYTTGEGGGVCQVSTTIYNAALLAGLKIVEVHNHTYLSHYVSGGRDATVSYGYYDLKFKNPYSHPIYLKNIVGNGAITTKIYGCDQDRERIYLKTEEQYKKDKIIIKTYRVYLDENNNKVMQELISTNNYSIK